MTDAPRSLRAAALSEPGRDPRRRFFRLGRPLRRPGWLAVAFGLPLLALATSGCREARTVVDGQVTGIKLTVRYNAQLQLTALAISGTVNGAPAFAPGTLPSPPRRLTSGQESASILVPSALAGSSVLVRVDGKAGATVMASEQQAVTIRASNLANVTMTLGERAVCGDGVERSPIETCDDGNTVPADGCSATCQEEAAGSCDATSCPNGCCASGFCQVTAFATCGAGGGACTACDPLTADLCSPAGVCACGTGAPCAAGQRCAAGSCVCDETSCPQGCCAAGACMTGDTAAACGTAGLACQICAAGSCTNGICSGCNAATCPNGCCSGATCYPRSVSTCGIGAAACVGCDPDKVDTCSVNGACRCGGKAPCADGQRCMNGACVCDATSCPAGCCAGDICQPVSVATCGMKGTTCISCEAGRADRCGLTGLCRCGIRPACAGGQRCAGGQCICDATSCPSGCCQGDTCAVRSLPTCGDAGSTCAVCDSRADNCSAAGACRCGTGPTCALGQRCIGSTCVCDGTSCPDGCCAGGLCLSGDTGSSCGAGGNSCETCPSTQVCNMGRCSGCNAATCPDGCCSGATCNVPTVAACGIAGATCAGCDMEKADACSAAGVCACGAGPACGTGQRCVGGACLCDATSCPSGCCDGAACINPSLQRCGSRGAACAACNPTIADTCTEAGSCACGAGAACAAGQRCAGGTCVCDPTSCPGGCCAGTTCRSPSLASCGPPGGACVTCGITADRCSTGGACQCGAASPCATGQRCVGGACICDKTSCAGGCCAGTTCLEGTSSNSCGSGGAACQDCGTELCSGGACGNCTATTCAGCCSGPTCTLTGSAVACGSGGAACVSCDVARADNCSMTGECRCGSAAACGAGTTCSSGLCTCSPTSCPNGCCSGGVCTAPSLASCGTAGQACSACNPAVADLCDSLNGTCRCGTGAACAPGTTCVGGSCLCNAQSCPGGCCAGGVCVAPSMNACGANGGTCVTCDPATADSCLATGTCGCGVFAPCGAGLHCVAGSCRCDATSCAGCCNANGVCLPGNKDANCGAAGNACQQCTAGLTCKKRACS